MFQYHKKEGKYNGEYVYTFVCVFNDVILSLVAELRAFLENSKSGHPAAPPPTLTFEECILDALTVLNGDDLGLDESPPALLLRKCCTCTCPFPGYGKK